MDAPRRDELRSPRRGSLWLEVFFDLVFLTLVASTLTAFVVWRTFEDELATQRAAVIEVLAQGLGASVATLPPRAFIDPEIAVAPLPDLLSSLVEQRGSLLAATLYDQDGQALLVEGAPPASLPLIQDDSLRRALVLGEPSTERVGREWEGALFRDILQHTAPVANAAGERRALRLWMPLADGGGVLTRLQRGTLLVMVADVLLLGLGGWLLIHWRLVLPLQRLAEAVADVSRGELRPLPRGDAPGEIGQLARNFNGMIRALEEARRQREAQLRSLEETNQELRNAQEELITSEKLASVGRLAAGVAHEVGNPLAAIMGYVDLLHADARDPDARDMLERVRDEVARIDHIIRELLDLARNPSRPDQTTQLAPLLLNLVAFMKVEPRFRQVQVIQDVPEALPDVPGPSGRLRQVFINLLFNASDALDGKGQISLSARVVELPLPAVDTSRPSLAPLGLPGRGRWVVVTVADNGKGIPAEHMTRIFDPFFTTKQPGAGTGLGLSVSLRITEALGGHIEVRSAPGLGTDFVLWLPARERGAGDAS